MEILIALLIMVVTGFACFAIGIAVASPDGPRFHPEMFGHTGSWNISDMKDIKDHHFFDRDLCEAIIKLLQRNGAFYVWDLGCGDGSYVQMMNVCKIRAKGIDGNKNTYDITNGWGITKDLTVPLEEKPRDWVLSLEVGEHIPSMYEDAYLDNVAAMCEKGVILSWAVEGQGGLGHVNCRNNVWVISKMIDRGFHYDESATQTLRDAAKIKWFKNTLMVFRK